MRENNNNLKFLDAIRGLAAVYVLIHHARLLLMQPFYEGFLKNTEKYNGFEKLLVYGMSIFKFGGEAVIIFFVLSGFVIHLKQAKQPAAHFDTLKYFKKRYIRIYPTVITAMIVTLLCAYLTFYFTGEKLNGYGINNFLGNLSLMPDFPSWGNNFPIWSLKHEWVFYLTYPILLFLNRRHVIYGSIIPLLACVFFALNVKIPLINEASYTLLIWWMGCLLAECYVKNDPKQLKRLALIIIPSLILLLSPLNSTVQFHKLFFGVFCIGVLAILLTLNNKILNKLSFLGSFSFSLYLLHFPIQVTIKNIYIYYYGMLPHNISLAIFGAFISTLITYPIYLITEKKAVAIKNEKYHR